MKEIILGKNGDQPFKIIQNGVSRQHAKIIIDDNDEWWLEDMNSTNGTFVRDEGNGKLQPVLRLRITPMTFINLGPDNAKGCGFYARQVLSENQGKYQEEFTYLQDVADKYEQKMEKVEKNMKKIRIAGPLISLSMLGLSVYLEVQNPNMMRFNMYLMRTSMFTSLFSALYDGTSIRRRLEKEFSRYSKCPNPECSYRLRINDVKDWQCPRCRK